MGVVTGGMGWEHQLSHLAGVHTCHTPDCMHMNLFFF
jgi:hypothetical protein